MLLCPPRETTDVDSTQGQDNLHLDVETADDDIVLVGIDGDVCPENLQGGLLP